MKIVSTDCLFASYLLNDFRNSNEIFRKDVAYDSIKSHKKVRFHPLSRKHIFGKIAGGKGHEIITTVATLSSKDREKS